MASWALSAAVFDQHNTPSYAAITRDMAERPEPGLPEHPVIVLAALRKAALEGRATDPGSADLETVRADARRLSEEIAAAVDVGLIQYTHPTRLGDILPGLLLASRWYDGRPLRVVDLGTSAGMLLLAMSASFRFPTGVWSPPGALADFDHPLTVPAGLLDTPLTIDSAVGIDLRPLDLRDPEAVTLLRSYEWPGPAERADQLTRGIRMVQQRPPHLIAGDVQEIAHDVIRERQDPEAVTVVIDSAFSHYMPMAAQVRLGNSMDRLAGHGPLVLITRGANATREVGRATVRAIDLHRKRRLVYAETDYIGESPAWLAPWPHEAAS